MKKLLTLFTIIFLSNSLSALTYNSLVGADISYQKTSTGQYQVTLNNYYYCPTPWNQFGNSVGIRCTAPNQPDQYFSLSSIAPTSGTEISQVCSTSLSNTQCSGGTLVGIKKYTYQGLIALSDSVPEWTLSYVHHQRAISSNILADQGMVVQAVIKPNKNNSSFIFTNRPAPILEASQSLDYSYAGTNPDEDSITYTFINSMYMDTNANYSPVIYASGYSGSHPMFTSILDSLSGQLSTAFLPANTVYFVAVKVSEYDRITKELKGSVTQDMLFSSQSLLNILPEAQGIQINNGVGTLIDSTTLQASVGDTLNFSIPVLENDTTSTIHLQHNIADALPGANVTVVNGNPATVNISWQVPFGASTSNYFTVKATDDQCPMLGITSKSYNLKVNPYTYGGEDQTICLGEGTQIGGTNDTSAQWTVISGSPIDTITSSPNYNFSCIQCSSPMASPQTTTTYLVTSSDTSLSPYQDTVTIFVAPNFTLNTGSDVTICGTDSVQLSATATPTGIYRFQWSDSSDLNSDTIENPMALAHTSNTYRVTVTSNAGCQKTAQQDVIIIPAILNHSILANPLSICQVGDSAQLNVAFTPTPMAACDLSPITTTTQDFTADVLLDYDPVTGTAGPITTLPSTLPIPYTPMFPAPFGNAFKSVKQQYIYLASELQEMGFKAGRITEIGFDITSVNGTSSYFNYSISIACVSNISSLPATIFPSSPWTSFVNVFTPQRVDITSGWKMLQFDTPYMWDGVSNLIVEICFDNRHAAATQNTSTKTRGFKTTTPGNQQFLTNMAFATDTVNACLSALANEAGFKRPDTRFSMSYEAPESSYNYTWFPNYNINDTSIQNPMVWPDTTTNYQLVIEDSLGNCSDTTVVSVYVSTDYTPIADTSICSGDTINLTTSFVDQCSIGATTITWSTNVPGALVNYSAGVATVSTTTDAEIYVTYSNACNCTFFDTILVSVFDLPAPNTIVTQPNCGLTDGIIQIQPTSNSSAYTYSTGNLFGADSIFNQLDTGIYSSQYMNINGCVSPSKIDTLAYLILPAPITTITHPICGLTNGEIQIHPLGNSSLYTYSIGTTFGSDSIFDQLDTGIYFSSYMDVNGCVSPITIDTLAYQNIPVITSISTNSPLCAGTGNGEITITANGGITPLEYSIDGGSTWSGSDIFNNLNIGNYQIIVKDSNSCLSNTDSTNIYENTPIQLTSNTTEEQVCVSRCVDLWVIATGGTGSAYSYTWNNGLPASDSQTVCPSGPMTLVVFANDSLGCISDSIEIGITLFDSLEVDAGIDQVILQQQLAYLNATASGGNGNYSYQWSPDSNLNDGQAQDPIASNLDTTTLYFVTVTDDCQTPMATDSVLISVTPNSINDLNEALQFTATSMFTPNEDGAQDEFKITGDPKDLDSYYYSIYNSVGKLVFTSTNLNETWNGRNRSNGAMSPTGIYIWTIISKENKGQNIQNGTVNLIR